MADAAVDVALRLQLQDSVTPALDRVADRAVQSQRRVAGAADDAAKRERQSMERSSRERTDLATSSEQRIRRELELSEAAYKRAAEASRLGAGVQVAALEKAQARVQALRAELERLQAQQSKSVPGVPGVPGAQVGRSAYERVSLAREQLGVRSEQRIQREIAATEAAYQRLARSGTLSAQEQARALDATRAKVTALTNEMGRLTAEQQRQARVTEQAARGGKALQYGGMAIAGVAAGAYALAAPVQRAMSFDERMAHMANTAFNERDVSGRRQGMKELEAAINVSVQRGGGTREQAAETLDALIASGAMPVADAIKMLPTLTKAGTAANADPAQLAQIGIRAMQTFKIDPAQLPNVMNMALAAGQAGGFELKDMAKWLPQQMAAATMSGMRGTEGFAKLAALNQAAAITAGTKDEAGNNVVNLLAKINSADTAKDAQKMGINLPAYLQQQRAKGVDSVDAFAALVDKTVQGRDDYKALQKQLGSAKTDDDKRAALESMTTIAQGAGIGKLIQDRQALMALLGMMNNRQYLGEVLAKVRANDRGAGGAVDSNFELISGTGAYRQRQRQEAMAAAEKSALDALPGGAAVNDALTALAQKFPQLTGGASLAATGLTAVAGAAGLAAIAMRSQGGGGGAFARAAGRAVEYLPGGKAAVKRAGAGLALGIGGDLLLDKMTDEGSTANRYGKAALNGASWGALLGPWGALAGAGVGALVEWFNSDKNPAMQEPPRMQAEVKVTVGDERVRVSQSMQATGVDATLASSGTGSIWQGAPL